MRKILTIGMAVMMVLMAFVVIGGNASAETITVDDDGGADYTSIQVAIDNACNGDTIIVAAGTYNERLNINKALKLRGAQYGVDPTPTGARTSTATESIITETGLSSPNPDVLIEIPSGVTGVTIDGFSLNGDPTNPTADTSTIRCWDDHITISNNIITGKYGVLYKGNDYLTVSQNRMTINKLGVTIQPNPASQVTISDNTFALGSSPAGGESAMYMTSTSDTTVSGNVANGFINGGGLKGSYNNNIMVSGNSFNGNKDGFSFWGSTTFITVSGNDLSSNTRYGINIKGQNIDIKDNTIHNNGVAGVNIDKHLLTTLNVDIEENSIVGNGMYGVYVNKFTVTTPVDATKNWWGDATGPLHATSWFYMGSSYGPNPGLGDDVSDNVLYDPWIEVQPGSAKSIKLEALGELNDIYPTGDKKVDKKLGKAIEHIEKSLDDKYWLDDNHLDPKHGKKVFDEEKKAIKELMHLMKKKGTSDDVKEVCQSVIDKLIEADDLLANTVYDEALAYAGDPKVDKELEKCDKEFEKAQKELDHTKKDGTPDPHYDKAINHYKHAWKHAEKALKHGGG